jgi:IS5 family transposase
LSDFELIVDSYEQPRERPVDNAEQKKCYSGKQKNPTIKNKLIVMPNGREIVDVVVGELGKTSDINIWRSSKEKLGKSQKFRGDKAYVGELAIDTPHKKARNREMTEKQKEENRLKAKGRIVVEHLIRLIKINRVARERFRLRAKNYAAVILTICGLIRWRIGAIILEC